MTTNGVACGRRVGKLYCPPGSKYYGCRHCYNLSYECRNEPHFARPGGIGHPLKLEREYENLLGRTKRRTYRGVPTRKARRLQILQGRMDACGEMNLGDLLKNP